MAKATCPLDAGHLARLSISIYVFCALGALAQRYQYVSATLSIGKCIKAALQRCQGYETLPQLNFGPTVSWQAPSTSKAAQALAPLDG